MTFTGLFSPSSDSSSRPTDHIYVGLHRMGGNFCNTLFLICIFYFSSFWFVDVVREELQSVVLCSDSVLAHTTLFCKTGAVTHVITEEYLQFYQSKEKNIQNILKWRNILFMVYCWIIICQQNFNDGGHVEF